MLAVRPGEASVTAGAGRGGSDRNSRASSEGGSGPESGTDAAGSAGASWQTMFMDRPSGPFELFELEALVAQRMEFLAWIDRLLNSAATQSLGEVITKVANRLGKPGQSSGSSRSGSAAPAETLGNDPTPTKAEDHRAAAKPSTAVADDSWTMSDQEDLVSHLLCRFAFCMSENWRKWFIRTEEVLLRARMKAASGVSPAMLMAKNALPCEPVDPHTADPVIHRFVAHAQGYTQLWALPKNPQVKDFVTVPMSLSTRLVRERRVLCLNGRVVMHNSQAGEVFVTVFKTQLARSLQDAYALRMKLLDGAAGEDGDDDGRSTVMAMLDAFLTRFIADPQDQLREMKEGVVRPGDIPALARTHFPLCMRRIDTHLRTAGHLKHFGRLTYGLFLKAIGLSLEDSLLLFSQLMTVKAFGSVEAFKKSPYGYNVRHNYGKEGKKTSYSSFSCGTIVAQPPMVDRMDCHGCPFRFRDEGALRQTLGKEQQHPYGAEYAAIKVRPSDIEDMVQDAKDGHYTRACYKFFKATHPDYNRDSLFRSPYEYYVTSREAAVAHERDMERAGAATRSAGGASTTAASTGGEASPEARDSAKKTLFKRPRSEDQQSEGAHE